jgi:hypothetical protein
MLTFECPTDGQLLERGVHDGECAGQLECPCCRRVWTLSEVVPDV